MQKYIEKASMILSAVDWDWVNDNNFNLRLNRHISFLVNSINVLIYFQCFLHLSRVDSRKCFIYIIFYKVRSFISRIQFVPKEIKVNIKCFSLKLCKNLRYSLSNVNCTFQLEFLISCFFNPSAKKLKIRSLPKTITLQDWSEYVHVTTLVKSFSTQQKTILKPWSSNVNRKYISRDASWLWMSLCFIIL